MSRLCPVTQRNQLMVDCNFLVKWMCQIHSVFFFGSELESWYMWGLVLDFRVAEVKSLMEALEA